MGKPRSTTRDDINAVMAIEDRVRFGTLKVRLKTAERPVRGVLVALADGPFVISHRGGVASDTSTLIERMR